MLLGDLVPGGIEALRVLLESPAQSGLLADGPDHGMKLDDPVRVLPPGSPVGGLVDIGAEGGPAAALTRKLPGDRLVLEPAPRVSCRRPGERRPIPGQRLGHKGRDVPLAVHPGAFRSRALPMQLTERAGSQRVNKIGALYGLWPAPPSFRPDGRLAAREMAGARCAGRGSRTSLRVAGRRNAGRIGGSQLIIWTGCPYPPWPWQERRCDTGRKPEFGRCPF